MNSLTSFLTASGGIDCNFHRDGGTKQFIKCDCIRFGEMFHSLSEVVTGLSLVFKFCEGARAAQG